MVAPWRVFGLSVLLLCAAACTTPTTTPAPTSSRPTPTELGQAATRPAATATSTTAPTPTTSATSAPTARPPSATPGTGTADAATAETTTTAATPAGIVTPTPTGGPCTNDVEYIADLTVPDGTVFAPGEPLLKQWSVQNAGTCDWDADYRLVLVSGNALGARSELALYPARAGLEAVIEVAMIAPAEPGNYTGRWQARDPAGNVFGDRIFITIQVLAPATPTETTTPTP